MLSLTLLVLCLASANAFPQDGVSASDIADSAANVERYDNSNDSGLDPNDLSLIDELFGSNSVNEDDYKPPAEEKQTTDTTSDDCKDYAEEGYQCTSYKLCDEFGEIITDGGPSLFDIRSGFIEIDPSVSKCPGDLEVCCRHPDFTGAVLRPREPPKPKPYVSKCGTRNSQGIGVRIQNEDNYNSNGGSTQFGEWPHMCAILEDKNDQNLFVCGASLIADDIVLTAAHCVHDKKDARLKVRCGEWDTQNRSEPVEHQDRYVELTIVHPQYSPRNLSNDVAILKTEEPFVLSAHIDIICLPDPEQLRDSYQWEQCVATGWGKDEFGVEGNYQVILKQVELPVVGNPACQDYLRETRLGTNFNLDPSMLCAGGEEGVDACKGDGGGPLVCPTGRNNGYGPEYAQAGIVAWGIECGKKDVPGVYASVAHSLCFIKNAALCALEGVDKFAHIEHCQGWIAEHREQVQNSRAIYQSQADAYDSPGDRNRRKLLRTVGYHDDSLALFDELTAICGEEITNQDLSGYQRSNLDIEQSQGEGDRSGFKEEETKE